MALRYRVSSYREMVYLAATFDRAFPAPFVVHQPVEVDVLAVDSVSSARGMEQLVLDRVRNYGWSATNRPGLRALAHLREMLACTDDHLRNIADHIDEGRPLPRAERMPMFHLLEVMAFVVKYAGEDCVMAVRERVNTLADRLVYLADNAPRHIMRFPPARIRNMVNRARREIADIMHMEAPIA